MLKIQIPMKAKTKIKATNVKEANSADNSLTRPMLSLEASKSILNQHGITYTDEEILIIREFMYQVAEITAVYYQRLIENDSIAITLTQTDQDETKSIPICSGEYRRAG
jgi:hypothetical protein